MESAADAQLKVAQLQQESIRGLTALCEALHLRCEALEIRVKALEDERR
jgi:hypothetical protein